MLNKKWLFLFCFVIFVSFLGNGQTGPGGIGSADGSSDLAFWYMADAENYTDGSLVNAVSDRSGYGRDLSASGAERPTFAASNPTANNRASFTFNLDDELQSSYQGNTNENMSFGAVMNYFSNAALNIAIQHGGRNTISVNASNTWQDFVGGSNHISTVTANANWTIQTRTFANSGANRLKYFMESVNTNNFAHNIQNRTSDTWIGGHGTGGGTGWSGNIAEVYKFTRVINEVERIIIENYLSAKYDIPLDDNDIYDGDNAANGDYDFDVAGIGRISAALSHNDSQGTGPVRISNANDLNNDEFLFWGHDGGQFQASEFADTPSPVMARMEREWRVTETNSSGGSVDVGAVDIQFDLSGKTVGSASHLRLLIDSDNDGFFVDETPISGAVKMSGDYYQFSNVTGLANGTLFTLGTTNVSASPLPVELISFNSHLKNTKEVQHLWSTASELNNDYFTIEKSMDGQLWEEITRLPGQGNSNSIQHYEAFDSPLNGKTIYYRLSQTDFDGTHKIIGNSLVQLHSNEAILRAYPNPSKGEINIEFTPNSEENVVLEIRDAMGNLVFRTNEIKEAMTWRKTFYINRKGVYAVSVLLKNQKLQELIVII